MRDDMIAESSDIRFACSQCGQRIVVEKSAAGLSGNCPVCEGPVIIPHVSSIHEAHGDDGASHHEHGGFAAAGLEEGTRGEVFSTTVELDRARRELDESNKEIERLRTLFKKTLDECERITASATHAQAEIKSFQSDRQQLKADLSSAKQRALAAESHAAELTNALAEAADENVALRQYIDQEIAFGHERLSATEAQIELRGQELAALQAENSEIVQSLAASQAELAALRGEVSGLYEELGAAQQLLNEAADSNQELLSAKQELESRLDESASESRQLRQDLDESRERAESLRQDLVKTDTGAELLDLRGRLKDLTEDRSRIAETLAEKRSELKDLATTEQSLRTELQEARRLREEAERQAAANSESQMNKDNEVLRGIVARQNTTLGVHFAEVRRLRRGRFALRIVYGLFGLALLGLVFFALTIFTHQDVEKLFNQFLN
jgi:chromosome segregation ATPase